jgi:hypothetical protein
VPFNDPGILRERPRGWFYAAAAVWLAAAGASLAVLAAYDFRSGAAATAPSDWPADTRLARSSDGPTLLMLAHPKCSCTVASLDELAEVLTRASTRPKTYVVFLKPEGFEAGWEQTALWQRAAALPGVTPVRDDSGLEARRFGAETSGQTLLYDARGHLIFSGGITASRGHAGDNDGRAGLLALLDRTRQAFPSTPVFGCPLSARGL